MHYSFIVRGKYQLTSNILWKAVKVLLNADPFRLSKASLICV